VNAVGLERDNLDVLPGGGDGDPAEAVGRDVVADVEAERVAEEAERVVGSWTGMNVMETVTAMRRP